MDLKPNRKVLVKKTSKKTKSVVKPPFWIPATGYYVLSISVTGIVFFILVGIWGRGDTPLMLSGVIASAMLGGAVILREIVFRERRRAIVRAQKRIDDNLVGLSRQNTERLGKPLTLERNKQLVSELKNKSRAADAFENLPETHRKVFELCENYLQRNLIEINRTGIASSKLQLLTSDRRLVRKLHKYHLLKWSAADSAALLGKAKSVTDFTQKIEYAEKSLVVIETALEFYPNETKLKDSSAFIRDFISNEKLKEKIAEAENELIMSHPQKSIETYRKVLKLLEEDVSFSSGRESLTAEIKLRIEKIKATIK